MTEVKLPDGTDYELWRKEFDDLARSLGQLGDFQGARMAQDASAQVQAAPLYQVIKDKNAKSGPFETRPSEGL